jgi:hypothetical protein
MLQNTVHFGWLNSRGGCGKSAGKLTNNVLEDESHRSQLTVGHWSIEFEGIPDDEIR